MIGLVIMSPKDLENYYVPTLEMIEDGLFKYNDYEIASLVKPVAENVWPLNSEDPKLNWCLIEKHDKPYIKYYYPYVNTLDWYLERNRIRIKKELTMRYAHLGYLKQKLWESNILSFYINKSIIEVTPKNDGDSPTTIFLNGRKINLKELNSFLSGANEIVYNINSLCKVQDDYRSLSYIHYRCLSQYLFNITPITDVYSNYQIVYKHSITKTDQIYGWERDLTISVYERNRQEAIKEIKKRPYCTEILKINKL